MSYKVVPVHSLSELWALRREEPEAYLIAGGTDSIPRIHQGIEHHPLCALLDIPSLRELRRTEEEYVIGAGVTLAALAGLREEPCIAAVVQAAAKVASPQIRARGTVGGNVLQENRCIYFNQSVSWRREECCYKLGGDRCYQYAGSGECVALFQSDLAPALMALCALAVLESPRGKRELPLSELYLDRGRSNKALEKDEVLTALRVPRKSAVRSAYCRESVRAAIDFPLISCAAAFAFDGAVVANARIVLGSADVRPARAEESEQLLCGKTAEEIQKLLPQAISLAQKKIMPLRDSRVDGPSRRALGETVIRKAILQCCEESQASTVGI